MSDGIDFGEALTQWRRDFGTIREEVRGRVRTVGIAGVQKMTRDAQIRAPVDTGNLRSSIGYEERDLAGGGIEFAYGPTVDYAPYVELGTSTAGPQPFIGPSFEANIATFEAAMLQVLGDVGPTRATGGSDRPLGG